MKDYYKRLIIILLLLLTSFHTYANNGGSSYSRYGLGDIRYFMSNATIGMGSVGISILTNSIITRENPASWTKLNNTMFSAGILYEGFSSKDNNGSVFLSSASFDELLLTIPIAARDGIVLGSGLSKFSNVNYNIKTNLTVNNINYELQHLGSGGISIAHLGLSATLINTFHMGAKLNYHFGTIQNQINQRFNNPNYTDASIARLARLKGIGYTFGIVYNGLGKILNFKENQSLNFGLTFSPTIYLNSSHEKHYEYKTNTITTKDTLTASDSKVKVPYSFGLGISYQSQKIILASDFYYQNWRNFDMRSIDRSNYRNSYRISAGCMFLPSQEINVSFFRKQGYQLGAFYNATYYQIYGEPINEIGLTGGIEIHIFRNTQLYIATEYIFRGTTNNNLQKDNILRFSISLNGSESWFIKQEED